MSHPKNDTMGLRLLVLLLVAGLGAAACAGCATLEQMVRKPSVVFRNVQLQDASLVQSTAVFNFDVHNPNPVGIPAGRVTYDLKLNGRPFVNGALDQGLSLPANATRQLRIPVTMPYLDFFQTLRQLWQNQSAAYLFNGSFSVGPVQIPLQARGRFDLPRMPAIALEAIQIQKYSLSGATLSCRLKLDNPNAFDLLFKRLNYDLSLGGQSFAAASARPRGPIAKNGQSTIDLNFNVSFARLGRSAYRLLQGRRADYHLDGGLIFDAPGSGEQRVPFNITGKVPFRR